jgi:hypothetical protein
MVTARDGARWMRPPPGFRSCCATAGDAPCNCSVKNAIAVQRTQLHRKERNCSVKNARAVQRTPVPAYHPRQRRGVGPAARAICARAGAPACRLLAGLRPVLTTLARAEPGPGNARGGSTTVETGSRCTAGSLRRGAATPREEGSGFHGSGAGASAGARGGAGSGGRTASQAQAPTSGASMKEA